MIWRKRLIFAAKCLLILLLLWLVFFLIRTQPTPGYGCTSGLSMDLQSSSTEGLKQAKQICSMMDIYENSFHRFRR